MYVLIELIVGLEYEEIELPIKFDTDYAIGPGGNETARDQLREAINTDRTAVILDQEQIERFALEESKVFAWDSTKRVYAVNAYHQLHCLVSISLPSFVDGLCRVLSYQTEKPLFCFDGLF